MTTTRTRTHRAADLLRALGAAVVLVLFVVGAPIALIGLAPVHLPDAVPTLGELGDALTSPDDGSLLFATLAVIGWVAWAAFTLSVVIEVVAGMRRMTAPSIPLLGTAQRAASGLLTTAALLVTLTSTTAGASPAAAASFTVASAQRADDDAPMTSRTQQAMTPRVTPDLVQANDPAMTDHATTPPAAPQRTPSVTVQRGDTLWDLAERHLGSGTRFAEIRDLNLGRPQVDGRALQDADWIYPGWTLLLPADATGTPAPDAPTTPEPSSTTVIVQPGDSLWSIAGQHLGDGGRFTELAALNLGRTQPDGATMTDPNLIHAGWHIILPGASNEPSLTAPAPSAAPSPAPALVEDVAPSPSESLTEVTPQPGPEREAAVIPVPKTAEPRPSGVHAERNTNPASYFAGFTALAAAGVIGEITRRRHLQRRARRVGESIPLPEPGSPEASTERALRSAPTPVTIPHIQTALTNLGCRCYQAERDLPRMGALTLDEHTVTLHLLEDDAEPVAPFTTRGARTWSATTSDIAAEAPIEDSELCVPYPALVTLGHTEDATLILNLEAAGTLAIVGDHEQAEAVLRAMVVELATSDLSGQLCVEADERFTQLAEAFDFVRLHTTDDPGPARSRHTRQVADVIADSGIDDTLQARSDRLLEDTWLPVIYVEHEPRASAPATPWSATILITRAPVDGAWTLELDSRGTARLSPLGIKVQPQRLAPEQLEVMRSLLLTSLPPSLDASHHQQPDATADIAAMAAVRQPDVVETDGDTEPTLHINVLGPIQITGLTNPRAPLSPRMQELLVYLALRGPASGPALDEVLWAGARVAPTTRNALIYRTRGRVGEDVLPRLEGESTFALGPGASTDWLQFQRRLTRALNGPDTERIDALSSALELVRDRPFLGIGGADYTWADHDIQQMISTIADAAHVLARLQLDAGRPRDALHTATLGLLVEPYSEQLQDDAINATEASAGAQAARHLRERFNEQLVRLDPELSA
ncbi:LysM peptidoglycan-binding domain-containing protein [Cellulomonas humilata]|uniref:LysM peptidoglycan-binding domain-containing protein n=1 Tax=Cellulomonas humilata TaxID=144055 RepID=A0A7Y5ZXD4_9CELL|nr:LysM peptidoglycan-binding domain-containing protein [Cellulomonas humilata]NUU15822.1 LysM peptidoglycan-binding domain-containing protein [Cellulomonas humilata]